MSEWLQLGLGGAALLVLLVLGKLMLAPLREIAAALRELGERVARLEGKLDIAYDFTPVQAIPFERAGPNEYGPERPTVRERVRVVTPARGVAKR